MSSLKQKLYERIRFILKHRSKIGLIIAFSYLSGCFITYLAISYILLYANNGNPTNIKEIIFASFVQLKLFLIRRRNKALFRITPKLINYTINTVDKYSDNAKYPFLRILPQTKPTNRYIFYDELIHGNKEKIKEKMKKPYSSKRVTNFRKICNEATKITSCLYPDYTKIKIDKLTKYQIECHWIAYDCSSEENGIIICLHGGGYTAGSPQMQYSLCTLLSKLTGCVCLSIDYRLCPEHPLPAAVNDVVNVYKYLLNERKISSTKLSLIGESAGGGLALLVLQRLNGCEIALPSCCWLNSPWTNLECTYDSWRRNSDFDAILTFDPTHSQSQLIAGNMDINGNKTKRDYVGVKDNKIFSPIHGQWKGLCPLYFMVGATEMLLEDTINAAIKAYECGVKVKIDIEPNMMHTWCLFQRGYVEAHYCVVRAADFILTHLK